MDPGNWATDLAGGSAYGYSLLWVVALSSLAAMLLQMLAVRLGVATGLDLAQTCRASYRPRSTQLYWLSCELAICATDLAEVIGTAIGLRLLFGIPLVWGVALTSLDVLVILWLQQRSFRYVEAVVAALILVLTQPHWQALRRGLLPHADLFTDPHQIYLAIGIIGATVMPHNLYLHSSIVQTRRHRRDVHGRRSALQFASIDTVGALSLALLVNAGLLVLAAAVLHASGHRDVIGIQQAYAGQVVMEGLLNLRIASWARRLLTRLVAWLPALAVTIHFGAHGIARLLILSQATLSLQLPFAISVAGWATAAIIIGLNGVLVAQFIFR